MYAKVMTATLKGIEGLPVRVETDLSPGLPAFLLVGLPGTAIREAGERIHRAMDNSGFSFPEKKITVNLSPASQKKEGTQFDLPIALGILGAAGMLPPDALKDIAFLGELSLDGRICPVRGALPLAYGLRKKGIRRIVIPEENGEEVSLLEDVELCLARSLRSLCEELKEGRLSRFVKREEREEEDDFSGMPDFGDVKGQEGAKRAMEVAAAGNHAILMIGPPGSGKTMMARCLAGILPPLSFGEKLEVTMLYSVAGELREEGYIHRRPFREPHHTVPIATLTGGGISPKPGEISLAHKGILFLDELAEYDRHVLEALREPMESKKIVLTRLSETVTYPADFLLAAASNPCPCGYLGDRDVACSCTSGEIHRYRSRLSGPILDRIDLRIGISRVEFRDLLPCEEGKKRKGKCLTTEEMRNHVLEAAAIQEERYKKRRIKRNSQLSARDLKLYCKTSKEGETLMEEAFRSLHLSARSYGKVLKVSRTIADLEGSEEITERHIAEALSYRME